MGEREGGETPYMLCARNIRGREKNTRAGDHVKRVQMKAIREWGGGSEGGEERPVKT